MSDKEKDLMDILDEKASSESKKSESTKSEKRTSKFVHSSNEIPEFLKAAEKIPSYMQEFVAQHRRRMSSNSKLRNEDLLLAEGESVSVFKTSLNGKRINLPMLKMRLVDNNAPIYVPINHAGQNYRHLDDFIGRRKKVAIDRFVQTNEGEADSEYILLGSIQQAEFVIGGNLYSEFLKDPDKVKDEVREGTVTQIIERPAHKDEETGEWVPNRSTVFIDYNGLTVGMPESYFHYVSQVTPLSQRTFVGQKVKFSILNITKGDYRDSPAAKQDAEAGMEVPHGIRYYIDITRLPFIPNPSDEIRRKLDNKTTFKARIVGVDPVKGILVEVAPSWQIKGYLPATSPIQPTGFDAYKHTPVTVRLNFVDFKNRSGQCQIIGFPQGVARAGISDMI